MTVSFDVVSRSLDARQFFRSRRNNEARNHAHVHPLILIPTPLSPFLSFVPLLFVCLDFFYRAIDPLLLL
jgi:hypothetical protein